MLWDMYFCLRVADEVMQDIIKRGGHKISALEVERVSVSAASLLLGPPLLLMSLMSRHRNYWSIPTFPPLQCVAYPTLNTVKLSVLLS
jgi:hypothetical protein